MLLANVPRIKPCGGSQNSCFAACVARVMNMCHVVETGKVE